MTNHEILAGFIQKIPSEYPKHMLCFFAANAARGNILPFTEGLLKCVGTIESAAPGYADEMFSRIAAITGKGEDQFESIMEILCEIFVTAGAVEKADSEGGKILFNHEPKRYGMNKPLKNPEFEVRFSGSWCGVEVKTPRLLNHSRSRASRPWQFLDRSNPREVVHAFESTLPRELAVKDFLISAEAKFADYALHRPDAFRLLVIVWDDFCQEPISALLSPPSGLLTPNSFLSSNGKAVTFSNIDGIVIIRYQHQMARALSCSPLEDGLTETFCYHHKGFPPKAFISIPGGRNVPPPIMEGLNLVLLKECPGSEYGPAGYVMWTGGRRANVVCVP